MTVIQKSGDVCEKMYAALCSAAPDASFPKKLGDCTNEVEASLQVMGPAGPT